MKCHTPRIAVLLLLAAGAAVLQVAAAAKCTKWQSDITKTKYAMRISSSHSWESVSKNGKVKTPYNQFCFRISEAAYYNNTGQTCKEQGFGDEDCCVDSKAAVVSLFTDPSCTSNKKSLASLKKSWFALDPAATAKSSREITAAFKAARGATPARFQISVKRTTIFGAGKELCINIPDVEILTCKTLRDLCGGAQCRVNITTSAFKIDKKSRTCCIQGSVASSDTCNCNGTGYSGPVCATPGEYGCPIFSAPLTHIPLIFKFIVFLACSIGKLQFVQGVHWHNNGMCIAPDTCSCNGTGYSGPNNGTCIAPDTCSCNGTGYSGPVCATPVICSPGSGGSPTTGKCTPCPAGSYGFNLSSKQPCQACQGNTFSDTEGSSACLECPAFSNPNANRTGCDPEVAVVDAAAGANITFEDAVDIAFPVGTFAGAGAITVQLVPLDNALLARYKAAILMHDAVGHGSFVVRVRTPTQPLTDVLVRFTATGLKFTADDMSMPNDEWRLMFASIYLPDETDPPGSGGFATLVPTHERVLLSTSTIITTLAPPGAFYEDSAGGFTAELLLVATRTSMNGDGDKFGVSDARTSSVGAFTPPRAWGDGAAGGAYLHTFPRRAGCATNDEPKRECASNATTDLLLRRRRLAETTATPCGGSALRWPLSVPAAITSKYDMNRLHPTKKIVRPHWGIDLAADAGTLVLAAHDGRLTVIEEPGGYGHYAIIKGAIGSTLYAHMIAGSASSLDGKDVKLGDQIGKVGSTGTSTGPHLHFEYAPSGTYWVDAVRTDPEPCLYTPSNDDEPPPPVKCDPETQPIVPPSVANAKITLPPGATGTLPVNLCMRPVLAVPQVDVVLAVDLTGSYWDDVGSIQALAPGLWDSIQAAAGAAGSVRMALLTFRDFGDAFVTNIDADFTTDRSAWLAAISSMYADGGNDWAEAQLIAVERAANMAWREGVARVLILTTDAGFHTGGDYGTIESALATLQSDGSHLPNNASQQAKSVKFIGLCAPGCVEEEMRALSGPTGGVFTTTDSASSDIVTAISGSLVGLEYTVTARVKDPGVCPASFSFWPSTIPDVKESSGFVVTETISVPSSVPLADALLTCEVEINSGSTVLATQVVTIDLGLRYVTTVNDMMGSPVTLGVKEAPCGTSATVTTLACGDSFTYGGAKDIVCGRLGEPPECAKCPLGTETDLKYAVVMVGGTKRFLQYSTTGADIAEKPRSCAGPRYVASLTALRVLQTPCSRAPGADTGSTLSCGTQFAFQGGAPVSCPGDATTLGVDCSACPTGDGSNLYVRILHNGKMAYLQFTTDTDLSLGEPTCTGGVIPDVATQFIVECEGMHKDLGNGYVEAYKDSVGVWTIGIGSITYMDGRPVAEGDTLTYAEATSLFNYQLQNQYWPSVKALPYFSDMSSNQRAAMLSFAYNLGRFFYGNADFSSITYVLQHKEWDKLPDIIYCYRSGGDGIPSRRFAEGLLWQDKPYEHCYGHPVYTPKYTCPYP
ncbi:MAG: hypothetical protein J3K34DRAFT_494343, partial [Monoraphidium minutum]